MLLALVVLAAQRVLLVRRAADPILALSLRPAHLQWFKPSTEAQAALRPPEAELLAKAAAAVAALLAADNNPVEAVALSALRVLALAME